jgi:ribosomal protein L29
MAFIQELRDLGDEELFERLESDKEELFNLRFQSRRGELTNPMRMATSGTRSRSSRSERARSSGGGGGASGH